MTVLLYRPSLDFTSGAGQLMHMQLCALRAAGVRAEIGCERGALRFLLRSGTAVRRLRAPDVRVTRPGRLLVDHGLCAPNAAVVFVHNVATEANEHLPRADWASLSTAEHNFFAELPLATPVVANSRSCAAATSSASGMFGAASFASVMLRALRSSKPNFLRVAGRRLRVMSALIWPALGIGSITPRMPCGCFTQVPLYALIRAR